MLASLYPVTKSWLMVGIGIVLGALISAILFLSIFWSAPKAQAQNACLINLSRLQTLYSAIFHRSLDTGAMSYIGYDFDFVVSELANSQEHGKYGKVYAAVKNLENFTRTSGAVILVGPTLTRDDYFADISTMVSEVEDWAKTLPAL